MDTNQLHLSQANEMILQFRDNPRTIHTYDLLNKAAVELKQIDFDAENNIESFKKARYQWLISSLELLQLLDQYYQPNFSPVKPYTLTISPPKDSNTDINFGNISPNEIKDPIVRKEYEEAINTNEEIKIEIFLQQRLAELSSTEEGYDIEHGFSCITKATIRKIYIYNVEDQKELKTAFDKYILTSERKKDFYVLLSNP